MEKLEKLLEKLFLDNGDDDLDIMVIPKVERRRPRGNCCTYNYAGYD